MLTVIQGHAGAPGRRLAARVEDPAQPSFRVRARRQLDPQLLMSPQNVIQPTVLIARRVANMRHAQRLWEKRSRWNSSRRRTSAIESTWYARASLMNLP